MIKYYFSLKVSEKTGLFHIVFKDIFAGRRLIEKFVALLPSTQEIHYLHNGGFQNSIVLSPVKGVDLWNRYLTKFIHIDDNGAHFTTSYTGELIRPENCCYCGNTNPGVTETRVENGRAVEQVKYCESHGGYYHDAIMQAAFDG